MYRICFFLGTPYGMEDDGKGERHTPPCIHSLSHANSSSRSSTVQDRQVLHRWAIEVNKSHETSRTDPKPKQKKTTTPSQLPNNFFPKGNLRFVSHHLTDQKNSFNPMKVESIHHPHLHVHLVSTQPRALKGIFCCSRDGSPLNLHDYQLTSVYCGVSSQCHFHP